MVGTLQPLGKQYPVVNADGTPTEYFIRWAQQKQIDIGNGVAASEVPAIIAAYLADHPLQAGAGIALTPTGNVADSPTIATEVQGVLDQLSMTQGTVLYRGATDWAALAPGTSGQFLKTNGAGANPVWANGGGGGWTEAKYYDQAVDGSAVTIECDVTNATEIFIDVQGLTNTNSVQRVVQVSVDGGTSWYTTSGNYNELDSGGTVANNAAFFLHSTATTSARSGKVHIINNRFGRSPVSAFVLNRSIASQFVASSTAINRVRVMGSAGATGTPAGTFNGGKVQFLTR